MNEGTFSFSLDDVDMGIGEKKSVFISPFFHFFIFSLRKNPSSSEFLTFIFPSSFIYFERIYIYKFILLYF